ncbi:sodium:calcium antiporter [Actinoallomurus sp. NBC_01490]|uniref:sodium:calcium antiporter n=1 Tax=Actinoallomurus sp. NBC_01490 TaxID=2903557 RepID=UPI002E311308|nr:sodium:calcium antiporter [Actinoallomurus sp. NBC_01490]
MSQHAMPVTAALGVVGIVMLSVAADQLVIGAARLAARLGVAPIVVGIVVIGVGTSAPELLVSATAAHGGHAELAIGNLTGSNVLNLTLVLGLAALVAPLSVRSSVVRREAPLAVGSVALFTATLVLPGLDIAVGVLLSAVLAVAFLLLVRTSRVGSDPLPEEAGEFVDGGAGHNLLREGVRAALGLAGTLAGAELLVSNAADFAARLGVSPQVIGFTLVALGTSLPELVTSIQAQRRDESDLVAGNLLGSTVVNSLGGGAVIALAHRGHPATGNLTVNLLMVAIACLVWALLARGHRLTRPEAIFLILLYGATLPLLA